MPDDGGVYLGKRALHGYTPRTAPLILFRGYIGRCWLATDIAALWYLRSNLMAALAASHGETAARDSISRITFLFQGHQPGGALRNRS